MDTGHTPITVTLGGAPHEATVPASYADREDISRAFHAAGGSVRRSRKAFSVAVALCVPALREAAGAPALDDFGSDDILEYGAVVYEALRAHGAKQSEISDAGSAIWPHVLTSLYPRAPEVQRAEDFSEAGAQRT
jgi:hypothetical protein